MLKKTLFILIMLVTLSSMALVACNTAATKAGVEARKVNVAKVQDQLLAQGC
jgi:predicted small secreted protein